MLGISTHGVYPTAGCPERRVRSYRTISPLPHRSEAVSFLWHFPYTITDAPAVSRRGALRCPDFPPAALEVGRR